MSETIPTEDKVLSPGRRLFMKGALATAGLVVLDGWRSLDQQQEQSDTLEQNTSDDAIDTTHTDQSDADDNFATKRISSLDDRLKEDDSFTDTVAESLVATGAVIGLTALTNNDIVKLYSGNSNTKDLVRKYKEQKLKTVASVVVAAPVLEETIFRGIPAIGGNEGIMPVRGIISTYLFGKAHQFSTRPRENPEPGKSENEVYLNSNKVPVPQYVLGAFYWMVARRKGLAHSMVAHATTNATAMAALEIGSRFDKEGPEGIISK